MKSSPRLDEPLKEPLKSYVRVLIYTLEQFADDLPRRPDAALWNARRSAEAIACVVAIFAQRADPWAEKKTQSLSDLVAKAKGYPDIIEPLLVVPVLGNTGAHIHTWTVDKPQWDDARFTAQKIGMAVSAMLEVADRECWPVLDLEGPKLAAAAAKLRDAASAPIGTIIVLAGEIQARLDTVTVERDEARSHAKAASTEIAEVRRNLGELHHRVATFGSTSAERISSISRKTEGAGARRALALAIAAALGGAALGFVAGVLGTRWHTAPALSHEEAAHTPETTSTGAPTEGVPGKPSPTATTDSPNLPNTGAVVPQTSSEPNGPPASSATTTPTTCPEGMILISAGRLILEQPKPRPWWPPAAEPSIRVEVPAFCIDAHPVTAANFAECVEKRMCARPGAPNNLGRKPAFPMNGIEHDAASTYCRNRAAELPNLAEWERALRVARRRIELVPETGEWAADPFPAPVLRRAEPKCGVSGCGWMWWTRALESSGDAPRLSWNQGSQALETLGFRCASR